MKLETHPLWINGYRSSAGWITARLFAITNKKGSVERLDKFDVPAKGKGVPPTYLLLHNH